MLESLKRRLFGRRRTAIYECRKCGTTVSANAARCPDCDSEAIAKFEIR